MKNKKGFTLIELLLVISIIALLSAIVLSSMQEARNRAKYTSILQGLSSARTEIELYKSKNNTLNDSNSYNAGDENCIVYTDEHTSDPYVFYWDANLQKILRQIGQNAGHTETGGSSPKYISKSYMICGVDTDDNWMIGVDVQKLGIKKNLPSGTQGFVSSICIHSSSSEFFEYEESLDANYTGNFEDAETVCLPSNF